MASTDLVFERPGLANPADLVFGDDGAVTDVALSFSIALPLTFQALLVPPVALSITSTLPLTFAGNVAYSNNVARPLVGDVVAPHQKAASLTTGAQSGIQQVKRSSSGAQSLFSGADSIASSAEALHQDAPRIIGGASDVVHEEASRVQASSASLFETMQRGVRPALSSRQQDGIRLSRRVSSGFADMLHDRRQQRAAPWAQGSHRSIRHGESVGNGIAMSSIRTARHQDAMRPKAGVTPTIVPPEDPCYLPDTSLVFEEGIVASGNLIFWCERHDTLPPTDTIIVPIRSVYVVINNISVRRVDGNVQLPTYSVTMSIDVDSWTWNFSASMPASTFGDLQGSGSPVELEVNINGNLYRVLAESLTRERSFTGDTISVRGRGKSAVLAAPYAPVLTFANNIQRTAQQLMADVLTFNNVSIGWGVDWQLTDWLVPAGAFAMQGAYIDGLSAIAGAAGAYLQSHPTDNTMRVMLRYPIAPWEWDAADADIELPSSAAVNEGIEWVDRAAYNRVFVSGTSHGITGQITRAGTAGDLVAPMVSDPLVTAVAAARQRGISILGNTGRKANVTLRYPVLPETGVITPGKMVRYVDGSDMLYGIVRSTNIDARFTEVWQTIQMEVQL